MRIYLDHNATTPALPAVAEIVCRVLTEDFGNPSSVHAFGQRAKAVLDDARAAVAALVDASPDDLVFVSGGTEANNLALRGYAAGVPVARRHLVTTAIEHEAVLNTARSLEQLGWRVTRLPVESSGILSLDAVRDALTPDTALVSVMHANNEIGTIQPVAAIAALAHGAGAVMHCDAVQTTGKIPVSVRELGVDMLSLSGHKFNGPKGAGALWIRRGLALTPTMTGGRHERSRRAGTENVAGIAGLGVAASSARTRIAEGSNYGALRDRLEAGILAGVPGTVVNGDRDARVPNTSNIGFTGIEAESLLIALDLEGFAVSTGAACSSGTMEPSHVLLSMGLPRGRARNSIRFSLGAGNTAAEIDAVIARLPALVDRLRRLTRPALARA